MHDSRHETGVGSPGLTEETSQASLRQVELSDRFNLSCRRVLLNGTQALVRLVLTQSARDKAEGLDTAGYVTGYRGSPLGAVDFQMKAADSLLADAGVRFQPALNEDLAVTALWGTQQAELRGEGRHDGVFGLWYGKGPGVDRSGDALRHANMAGCSRHGGVVMALGDDHTGESSTTLHQSEWTMIDSYVPVLSPAGVQEIIDFGLIGFAMARFSGNWVGLKCVKEIVESTAVIDGHVDRMKVVLPRIDMPTDGLNIRLHDSPVQSEARVIDYRVGAAEKFAHANSLDKRVHGQAGARIGIVAAGKNWLDVVHALELLGLDHVEMMRLGITSYKIAMTWPLDRRTFLSWARDLELVIVVEEKRKLIEQQIRDSLFDLRNQTRVYGHHRGGGRKLFPTRYELTPVQIARGIGTVLEAERCGDSRLKGRIERVEALHRREKSDDILSRQPYFCSGCPHSTSTRIPEGSRAYAGIGCHYMVQWMDRDTLGFTQMGGEGANWIGEAPFSKRRHVFQNIGDGTYNHSGLLAIRAAQHAGVNVTFKVLFNDAVAMTGGQRNDGNLTPQRILRELQAAGVENLALVHDSKEGINLKDIPRGIRCLERSRLDQVQREFVQCEGVSAIVYVQTCAAEKRRRRRRGTFAAISERVYINTDVCEGCGDCGVQSNCLSIVPVETEFGRKRAIDQSSCNMDLSCLNGFCPSFVSVKGGHPRARTTHPVNVPRLPEPELPVIDGTHNTVITGVGGTGVVTIGAVMAMAAHLDGLGVGMIEMAGLAQKGGAVTVHCRMASSAEDISAVRVSAGEAHCLIGGDIVTAANASTLDLVTPGHTIAAINRKKTIVGEFTRNANTTIPVDRLQHRIESVVDRDRCRFANSSRAAEAALGDSIYSNVLLLGTAWQLGGLPLSRQAIQRAIELNGASAKENLRAFELGRWIAIDAGVEARVAERTTSGMSPPVVLNPVEYRRQHLIAYQDEALARRYTSFVGKFEGSRLHVHVAKSYHKVLATKDEFEVARLHLATRKRVASEFAGHYRIEYHLAPPLLSQQVDGGRPAKHRFGPYMHQIFRLLARCRKWRGTWLDPFRYGSERKLHREQVVRYEQDMQKVLESGVAEWSEAALILSTLPLSVKGYGPVWMESYKKATAERSRLLRQLDEDSCLTATGQTAEALAA